MKEFAWGWITSDGVRCKSQCQTNATPDKIIGVWGLGDSIYYETFLKECLPFEGEVNNWTIRPLATLLDINKERTHQFAGNKKLVINEIVGAPEPKVPKRTMQKWVCKCGHSFYTNLTKPPGFLKRIWTWIRLYFCPELIDCQSCHTRTAKKAGIVKKDIRKE